MNNDSFIDDVMGFDPSNLDAFQEKTSSVANANIYKTNPKNSKAEDGHYRCKLKVIYNPYNFRQSIVHQATYAMNDQNGFFMVKSVLGNGDKSCPIFKSWKQLWFSGDEAKKEWAKKIYDKSETDWCLVQIMEDQNQPELVGQIRVMKLPQTIYTKLKAKTNPAPESGKSPVAIMDYLIGLPLDMDVTPGPDDPQHPERKQREISYDLCEFDTEYAPITKVDGTNLFTDDELELIESFDSTKKKIAKAKTEKAKKEAQAELDGMLNNVKALYAKAINYLKDEAHVVDLVEECSYQPWTPEVETRVQAWINTVLAMQDPKQGTIRAVGDAAPADVAPSDADAMANGEEPLPF